MTDALSFLLPESDPKASMRARMESLIKSDVEQMSEIAERLQNPKLGQEERQQLEALLAQYKRPNESVTVSKPAEVVEDSVKTWRGMPLTEAQFHALRRVRHACGGVV